MKCSRWVVIGIGVWLGACGTQPASGDTGDSGVLGDTGDTGVVGDSGDTGDTGDTGTVGDTGDTGTALPPEHPAVWGLAVLEDENPTPGIVEVTLEARPAQLERAGYTVSAMTYNGQPAGPLLQANVGDEVIVHFNNNLNEPTTVHWHGLRIPDVMDGSPRVQDPVQAGESFEYRFVVPEAGSFWYHPHVRTHVQVERGLYGPVVIHDPADPDYDLERYLMLDDILLDANGNAPPPLQSHPEVMHGRSGNILLTNGVQSDQVTGVASQGNVERWRLVNTANARTLQLSVTGATVRVIGTDGGLIRPVPLGGERLELPVGARYDLEVSYDQPGAVELLTHVLTTNASGDLIEIDIPMFQVEVEETGRRPQSYTVSSPSIISRTRAPTSDETIVIDAVNGPDGQVQWRLNGESHSMTPLFTFQKGDTVRITLENMLGPEHPFHLHGQFFRVTSPAMDGLRDTVLVPGMGQVELIAYFDNPGQWMAHCHILEHAELGMMSEIVVEGEPGLLRE